MDTEVSYIPPEYNILELENNSQIRAIEFVDGPYAGLIFSYGKVELLEDDLNDELRIKFDWTMHTSREPYEDEVIVPYLGDFLMMLISKQLDDKEIIYSGGADSSRPIRD